MQTWDIALTVVSLVVGCILFVVGARRQKRQGRKPTLFAPLPMIAFILMMLGMWRLQVALSDKPTKAPPAESPPGDVAR